MKKAKAEVKAAAIEILCSQCGENIAEPKSGSFLWEFDFIPSEVTCHACGAVLTVPRRRIREIEGETCSAY